MQCVARWKVCNGQVDCDDHADEDRCEPVILQQYNTLENNLPLKIDLSLQGKFTFSPYNELEFNTYIPPLCTWPVIFSHLLFIWTRKGKGWYVKDKEGTERTKTKERNKKRKTNKTEKHEN